MTEKTPSRADAGVLAGIIEAYGADAARWPREYAELYETARRDPALSALLARERALDSLLDRLPEAKAPSGAVARLQVRFEQEGAARAEAAVVPFAASADRDIPPAKGSFARWRSAAALMAASLLLGIYIGQSDLIGDLSSSLIATLDPGTDVMGEAVYWLTFEPGAFAEETL